MARISTRQILLKRLEDICYAAVKHGNRLRAYGMSTTEVEGLLYACYSYRKTILKRRYLKRLPYRKRNSKFHIYLDPDHPDGFNDREFKYHFRLSRECFWELVDLLKPYAVFNSHSSDSRGPSAKPVSHQVLVLLKYYGCEGNSSGSMSLSGFLVLEVALLTLIKTMP